MNCEDCIYYEEQPFIREGDYNSYCKRTNKTTTPYDYCRKHKKQKRKEGGMLNE